MAERTLSYFVSDVHLGLQVQDADERERRFLDFLGEIPVERTENLFLLGDIWDFWYEYRDVIPKQGVRVVAEFIRLMNEGVKIWFVPGNHDIWCYSFFESIGIRKCQQPLELCIGGKTFHLGHGDMLGPCSWQYRLLQSIFHGRFYQVLFSSLHPWIGFRIAEYWSGSSRKNHRPYRFRGVEEPLYIYSAGVEEEKHVDFFVFGHFHDGVRMSLPRGAELVVLRDWMDADKPYALFDAATSSFSLNFEASRT